MPLCALGVQLCRKVPVSYRSEKLRKIGAFQSVPYHTVPAQELNTKAFEEQLAGCIVFQRFFPARCTNGRPDGEKTFRNLLIIYSPKSIHIAGQQSVI